MNLSGKSLKKLIANFFLVLTTFFWGLTFVVVKDAVSSVDVFVFLAQRFSAAFLCLLAAWPLIKSPASMNAIKKGLILGLLLFSGYSLQTLSLVYTSASNTAFLTGMMVVFVPVLSFLIFGKRVRINTIAGVILSFAGLYLMCAGTSWSLNKGDILGLFCAVAFASHIIFTGKFARQYSIYWLTTIQIGAIGIFSTIIATASGNDVIIWYPEIKNALIICVLFATVFAYLVQTTMQQFISPASTALILCLEPVFAAVCAYFIAGETLGSKGMTGAALIVIGMVASEAPVFHLIKNHIRNYIK